MTLKELRNCNSIIAYNDDCHGTKVFVNGELITNMDNGLDAAVKLIEAGQRSDPSKFIIDIAIDLYDILENYDSQTADRIHAILSQSVLLTESQVLALINKTYEKL